MNEILAALESGRSSAASDPWILRAQLHNKHDSRDRLIGQMHDPSRDRKHRRRLALGKRY